MASPYYDIEQIEGYLRQELPQEKRQAFEQALQSDAGLQQEVAAYQKLFSGFEGMQEAAFGEAMSTWESEWEDEEDTELIEWYINKELPPQLMQKLLDKEQNDPEFRKQVAQYRKLYSGLEGTADQQFQADMQAWEKQLSAPNKTKTARIRPLWQRLAAAASVLLVLGFGMNWYVQTQYANEQLFESYYQAPKSENTLSGETNTLSDIASTFQDAHNALQTGNASEAVTQFDALLAQIPNANLDAINQTYFTEQSQWGKAMALLQAKQPKAEILQALQPILADENHTFHQESTELKAKLESFWHKLAN